MSGRARALLDLAFGDGRFAKTAERLREGRLPAAGLSFVATERGRIVGTVRLWNVSAGPGCAGAAARAARGRSGAAQPRHRRGADAHALAAAQRLGHRAVLLVGDAPYYGRFGFSAAHDRRRCGCRAATTPRRLLALRTRARRARRRARRTASAAPPVGLQHRVAPAQASLRPAPPLDALSAWSAQPSALTARCGEGQGGACQTAICLSSGASRRLLRRGGARFRTASAFRIATRSSC